MSRKIRYLFVSFFLLGAVVVAELTYLNLFQGENKESTKAKYEFVASVGLPDLAISQEPYIRHRTLTTSFDIYSLDGVLREYENATYIIAEKREVR
jgi:hypothetical protein